MKLSEQEMETVYDALQETVKRESNNLLRMLKARLGAKLREKVVDFDEIFDEVVKELER